MIERDGEDIDNRGDRDKYSRDFREREREVGRLRGEGERGELADAPQNDATDQKDQRIPEYTHEVLSHKRDTLFEAGN